jgi:hypothetical protein
MSIAIRYSYYTLHTSLSCAGRVRAGRCYHLYCRLEAEGSTGYFTPAAAAAASAKANAPYLAVPVAGAVHSTLHTPHYALY